MRLILRPALGASGSHWPSATIPFSSQDAANLRMFLHHLLRGLALALDVPCACVCIQWQTPPRDWVADSELETIGNYVIQPLPASEVSAGCGECCNCGDPCDCLFQSTELRVIRVDSGTRNCVECLACCLCERCVVRTSQGRPLCLQCLRDDPVELERFLRIASAARLRRYQLILNQEDPPSIRVIARHLLVRWDPVTHGGRTH